MGWTRRAPASRSRKPAWGYENQEHPMPRATSSTNVIATIGIDIGKNTFHVIGLDDNGAIILRHKLSRRARCCVLTIADLTRFFASLGPVAAALSAPCVAEG